jgi:DNA helicase II / ATP-dependent DNA helicase PcrA
MKFYADLHIHSSYSRATSKQLSLEQLYIWGQRKGIQVIGTGDCLHPLWLADCKKKFRDERNGLFSLKDPFAQTTRPFVPKACSDMKGVRFMLTVEISTIYKKNDKVRKVHHVVCLPSFKAADKLFGALECIGNLRSDGRPILGLDSRDLLEMVLEADPTGMLIPAHIWTPWFSALGSKSGFDSIPECYGDLTRFIYAVETGLSSDPLMNWQVSGLDPFALVSFSDAHSASKLGRECTIFDTELSYDGIFRAISNPNDPGGLSGTLEFFPEEGKYHVDGHRNCKVRFAPDETIAHNGTCPVCDKPLTVGVMSRVRELADRKPGLKAPRARPYKSLVPLAEVIAEAFGKGPATKSVIAVYEKLLETLGSELNILLDCTIKEIESIAGERTAEGINNMREGKISINPGYDGEFGTVKLIK